MDRFGGIYEHSPWVAERCWQGELGAAHDSAAGLAAAMAQLFRAASDDERLAVLRAHPDLAGKPRFVVAKRIATEVESRRGQAHRTAAESAGERMAE